MPKLYFKWIFSHICFANMVSLCFTVILYGFTVSAVLFIYVKFIIYIIIIINMSF